MSDALDKAYLIRLGVTVGVGLAMAYVTSYLTKAIMEEMAHPRSSSKRRGIAEEKLHEIGIRLDDLEMTKHETEICSMLIVPSSIDVTWEDIGGLDEQLDTLKETVIMPILHQDIFNRSKSKLLSFPKGVLLQGPPGCGKTMIAKATARESDCILLNIDISVLHDMWVGESAKFVTAIFTLAEKLSRYSPVIVFIDEIDTLLSTRTSRDHENSQQIKSSFMTHWDGLISSPSSRIVVMGATNIPQSIDAAVYRRMPVRITVGLPDQTARLKILQVLLKDEALDGSVDLELLARATKTMSGSDLKEFCSQACMVRYREIFRRGDVSAEEARPVTIADFRKVSHVLANSKLERELLVDGAGGVSLD